MEPPFRIKIKETDGRILPLHWLRKNTAKYSIRRILFILKRCLTFEKKLLHFYVLNSFYMFWVQGVSRKPEFYVSTVRFCALILEMLWKIYVTEFSYRTYHGSNVQISLNICIFDDEQKSETIVCSLKCENFDKFIWNY